MEAKHSALPWRTSEFGRGTDVVAGDGARIVAECKATKGSELEECAANADFIVRACNSHYQLLSASRDTPPGTMSAVAGEKLDAGDFVCWGDDGKVYKVKE